MVRVGGLARGRAVVALLVLVVVVVVLAEGNRARAQEVFSLRCFGGEALRPACSLVRFLGVEAMVVDMVAGILLEESRCFGGC